jgi:hypothetical protein
MFGSGLEVVSVHSQGESGNIEGERIEGCANLRLVSS